MQLIYILQAAETINLIDISDCRHFVKHTRDNESINIRRFVSQCSLRTRAKPISFLHNKHIVEHKRKEHIYFYYKQEMRSKS